MRDREEPTLGKPDLSEVEFRPHSYRGPSLQHRPQREEFQTWKIGIAVCIAVFAALMLFNMYERHQDRKDAQLAMQQLEASTRKMEADSIQEIAAVNAQLWQQSTPQRPQRANRPLANRERCMQGRRFERVENGWIQLPNDPC